MLFGIPFILHPINNILVKQIFFSSWTYTILFLNIKNEEFRWKTFNLLKLHSKNFTILCQIPCQKLCSCCCSRCKRLAGAPAYEMCFRLKTISWSHFQSWSLQWSWSKFRSKTRHLISRPFLDVIPLTIVTGLLLQLSENLKS